MQHALSRVLEEADQPFDGYLNYYAWLRAMYDRKRQKLLSGLKAGGLEPTKGEGGFFIMADARRLIPLVPSRYFQQAAANGRSRDFALCRWLGEEHNLVVIPGSPFFQNSESKMGKMKDESPCLLRMAFCKRDEILERACERFKILGHQVERYEAQAAVPTSTASTETHV